MIHHEPVLVDRVLEYLQPRPGGRYLDGTVGFGGHALAILKATRGRAEILGLDRDPNALRTAESALKLAWPDSNTHLRHERFSRFAANMDEIGWKFLDGALLDLGVSSYQLDNPERGFSFLRDGPLDMRMDDSGAEHTARKVVNVLGWRELATIIGQLGEEPLAGRIARRIESTRVKEPIETTLSLAGIVEAAYPPDRRAKARRHPATRTFQALRMFVNDELGELSA